MADPSVIADHTVDVRAVSLAGRDVSYRPIRVHAIKQQVTDISLGYGDVMS